MHVAAIQCQFSEHVNENLDKIEHFITQSKPAQVILAPELFATYYFCTEQNEQYFSYAYSVNNHPWLYRFQNIAKLQKAFLLISFFEKEENVFYNSLAIINPLGDLAEVYRKSHIPDGPGYQEKYYFRPGNTGFKVIKTNFGNFGVGICWDQWFPECARSLTLMGADVIFYPTAIGSEPKNPELNTQPQWTRAMIGHAASNCVGIVAANRIGLENQQFFYGHSFIADETGSIMCSLDDQQESILSHVFSIDTLRQTRAAFGFFRDRRPELYATLVKT